jgi:hypothetical protein
MKKRKELKDKGAWEIQETEEALSEMSMTSKDNNA